MAFDPVYGVYVGMLPIQEAAAQIISDDFVDALAWRCGLDGSTPGADLARVQFINTHSRQYPALIIHAGESRPSLLGTGGIEQFHIFECELFIAKSIDAGGVTTAANDLERELHRYFDAAAQAFASADANRWMQFAPDGANVDRVRVSFANVVFGNLLESNGLYRHSLAFELQVRLIEGEN